MMEDYDGWDTCDYWCRVHCHCHCHWLVFPISIFIMAVTVTCRYASPDFQLQTLSNFGVIFVNLAVTVTCRYASPSCQKSLTSDWQILGLFSGQKIQKVSRTAFRPVFQVKCWPIYGNIQWAECARARNSDLFADSIPCCF